MRNPKGYGPRRVPGGHWRPARPPVLRPRGCRDEVRDGHHGLHVIRVDAPVGRGDRALALRVDAAASAGATAWELAQALVLADEERSEPAGLVRDAFHYGESSRRSQGRGFFVPMMEGDGFCHPPHIEDVPAEVGLLWGAVADQVRSPLARARLSDLCFEGHWGNVGEHGRAAVDAYLEMSKLHVYALDEGRRTTAVMARVDWLCRALALASRMGDAARSELAVAAIVKGAEESLAQERAEPGAALGLIEALVEAHAESDELLEAAHRRYADDQWNTDQTLLLQLRRVGGDEERRRTLQRARVVALMDHAESCEPLVRMSFLKDAIQLGRDYGFTELVQECTLRLQSIKEEDLGLKQNSVEIPIPAGAIEKGVREILEVESWQDALRKLSSHPPSGDATVNHAGVQELMQAHPIASLFPEEVLGGDGLPRIRVTTDEEKREKRLVERELLSMQLDALVLNEALVQIWNKWGPISEEELAAFLGAREHVRPELAAALARAFLRFFNGDPEGATFTAVPRLEALARELVLKGNLPAYRTERANSPGQYPGLGALLAMLRAAGLDESWTRYLGSLLSNPMGPNARNELLHGFVDIPPEPWAPLVFVGVLFLAVHVEVTAKGDECEPKDA
jgi:hypothetical protein